MRLDIVGHSQLNFLEYEYQISPQLYKTFLKYIYEYSFLIVVNDNC